jgi:dTDP-4-dehydrorhamnose reductase
MKLLITGARGMLGKDVARAAAGGGHEVLALSHAELDITDADAVLAAVEARRPDVVLNCAAWTDVDGAEARYDHALAVNGVGARQVARAAADCGAWVVYVSSDYVFSGRKNTP